MKTLENNYPKHKFYILFLNIINYIIFYYRMQRPFEDVFYVKCTLKSISIVIFVSDILFKLRNLKET